MPETVALMIEGMTCPVCSHRIEKCLLSQPGILQVEIHLDSHQAQITYDNKIILLSTIVDHIALLGFHSTIFINARASKLSIQCLAPERNRVKLYAQSLHGIYGVEEKEDEFLILHYDPQIVGGRTLLQLLQLEFGTCIGHSEKQFIPIPSREHCWWMCCIVPILVVHFGIPLFTDWNPQLCHGLTLFDAVGFICATPMQFLVAQPIYHGAYLSISRHHRANMDVLIALSSTVAYFFSIVSIGVAIATKDAEDGTSTQQQTFFEVSCLLIFFAWLARKMEGSSKKRTMQSIQDLMQLQVKTALLVTSNGIHVSESYIDIDLVQRGDLLKILPGARIPTDGIVVAGSSKVDESMLTGESASVQKDPESTVIGGTINQYGVLTMKATRGTNETLLAEIIRLVEDAYQSKPNAQLAADVMASQFTIGIIVFGFLTFLFWYLMCLEGYVDSSKYHSTPLAFSVKFGITVLVVRYLLAYFLDPILCSCPCAISLAVPTAVLVATGVGARLGVLFKSGQIFEALGRIDTVVFDKVRNAFKRILKEE